MPGATPCLVVEGVEVRRDGGVAHLLVREAQCRKEYQMCAGRPEAHLALWLLRPVEILLVREGEDAT